MTKYPPLVPIYENSTPISLIYPDNIEVKWKELEDSFICEITNKISNIDLSQYDGICHVAFGDLDVADPNFSFEVFLMQYIAIPYTYDDRSKIYPAGYKLLMSSDDLNEWGCFVSKLNALDRTKDWDNAPFEHTKPSKVWRILLEEQYMVCALRALRKACIINPQNIYCGFAGDTAEEWVHRRDSIFSL